MISLDRIMLPVLAAGKMKNSENYLWNNVAFTNWARNYEYAKTHCAPGILTHAHEARQTIVDLESEIADLETRDKRELGRAGIREIRDEVRREEARGRDAWERWKKWEKDS